MLKAAQLYEEELAYELTKTWYDDEFKYYAFDSYYASTEIASDTWESQQFVSVDRDDNIVGFISYKVNRQTCNAHAMSAINLNHNKVVFGADLIQAIDDIFMRFNLNKLDFDVVIGNPAEKTYDKFIKMCKGRVVGTLKNETKLIDNNLYDVKLYEIMRDNWVKNRHKFYK